MQNTFRLRKFSLAILITGLFLVGLVGGCAAKKKPLDSFVEYQKRSIHENAAYEEAEFNFWAALYEPVLEDLQKLRTSWVEHSDAFPESKDFSKIEREVRNSSQKVVMVALFVSDFDRADLRDESLGWVVHPIPKEVEELSEKDAVIRTLMPVRNRWARYFLLTFEPEIWHSSKYFVISNPRSRLILKKTTL